MQCILYIATLYFLVLTWNVRSNRPPSSNLLKKMWTVASIMESNLVQFERKENEAAGFSTYIQGSLALVVSQCPTLSSANIIKTLGSVNCSIGVKFVNVRVTVL